MRITMVTILIGLTVTGIVACTAPRQDAEITITETKIESIVETGAEQIEQAQTQEKPSALVKKDQKNLRDDVSSNTLHNKQRSNPSEKTIVGAKDSEEREMDIALESKMQMVWNFLLFF